MAKCPNCNKRFSIFKQLLLFKKTYRCPHCETYVVLNTSRMIPINILNVFVAFIIGMLIALSGYPLLWSIILALWGLLILSVYSRFGKLKMK